MTMQLSILLSADAKQAKAEVAAIEGALAKMGKTAGTADGKTKGLTKSTTTLDAAVNQAKRNVQQLSAAEVRNAATAGRMGAANNAAAGQIGNLAAQFNDIGVMLAAGQNPLQLALQQGTQITQVIGPMGAAGAVKALGGAIVSMINPVSLLTIGTIAGGAAFFQWATRASDASAQADVLIKKMEALEEAQAGLTDEVRRLSLGVSTEELTILDAKALKKREILALENEISAGLQRGRRNAPRELEIAQQELSNLEAQLSSLRVLQEQKERLVAATREQSDAERLVGETIAQGVAERAKAAAEAQQLISQLQSEANIRALITKHGADSVQVATARVAAERAAFIELQKSAGVSETMQTELIAAWDAAKGVAGVDMAGNITLAAGAAQLLSQRLGGALDLARRIAGYQNSVNHNGLDETDPRNPNNTRPGTWTGGYGTLALNDPRRTKPKKTGGGGGRGKISAAQREQKAVDDLIASLTKQRDVIAETDPVQKEMIQNRKVLAKATDAERKTVEDLIAARIAEEAATEQATERADFYGNVISSALDEATRKGASLDDVLKNIAGSFIDAGIQAAIFGEGPFGSVFGGSSILDVIFPQKKADGGMIYGAGGPRDDKVPVLASPGEFMVNARATARNRHLLEAMNAGGRGQALAAGGMIGGGSAPSAASGMGGGNVIHLHYDLTGARGNTEIIEAVKEGIEQGLREYDREVLPGRVMEISENPRMVG